MATHAPYCLYLIRVVWKTRGTLDGNLTPQQWWRAPPPPPQLVCVLHTPQKGLQCNAAEPWRPAMSQEHYSRLQPQPQHQTQSQLSYLKIESAFLVNCLMLRAPGRACGVIVWVGRLWERHDTDRFIPSCILMEDASSIAQFFSLPDDTQSSWMGWAWGPV